MTKIILNDADMINSIYDNENTWKELACKDFDEKIILYGNSRHIPDVLNASWYTKYKYIVTDADDMSKEEFEQNYIDEYSPAQIHNVYNIVNYTEGEEELIIKKVIEQLDPGLELECITLKGLIDPNDWKKAIYIKDSLNINKVANFIFGDIHSVEIINEDGIEYDNELFNDRKTIKEKLRTYYNIPKDEELIVKSYAGYTQITNYDIID